MDHHPGGNAEAGRRQCPARRDLRAAGASWLAIWGVYSAYYWTNDPEDTLQTVYVPAIGVMSLLGAWLVTRIPGRAWRGGTTAAVVTAMFVLGAWSFHAMVAGIGGTGPRPGTGATSPLRAAGDQRYRPRDGRHRSWRGRTTRAPPPRQRPR